MRIIRKPLKVTPRKKLRAAAQRSAAKYAEEDYSAEEPNVKLSRAFVVVLLLHVVAVGGIFAFSALKDHQTGSTPGKAEAANQKASSDARQRRHENQGRRINPPAKQFRRTSKNWWIPHTHQEAAVRRLRITASRRRGPANPRKCTWSKEEIVPPGSPRSSKLVTRIC